MAAMGTEARERDCPAPRFGKATCEAVLDAPPHMVAEVLAGTRHIRPRPASPQGFASSGIVAKIIPPFGYGNGSPGGWWITFEPELHLGNDIVVPDVAGWRRGNLPEFPRAPFFAVPPDWICEVLSPSTQCIDQNEKRSIYARGEGVSHLWFVDSDARTLEAFELGGQRWTPLAMLAENAPASLPPFDAITFALDALGRPAPPPAVETGPRQFILSRRRAYSAIGPGTLGLCHTPKQLAGSSPDDIGLRVSRTVGRCKHLAHPILTGNLRR